MPIHKCEIYLWCVFLLSFFQKDTVVWHKGIEADGRSFVRGRVKSSKVLHLGKEMTEQSLKKVVGEQIFINFNIMRTRKHPV